MKPKQTILRTRALTVGNLRAFDALARHLNFRIAAEELALTQSAISRQIQSLEDEIGVSLFLRHTRSVEITHSGVQLLHQVAPFLTNVDATVRQIRRSAGRRIVTVSTWASFATQWLIPRLSRFQQSNPDIDIRIDATDSIINLETSEVDLVLRYAKPESVPQQATFLFGEQLALVASPGLIKNAHKIKSISELKNHTFIEADNDPKLKNNDWLSWQRWFDVKKVSDFEPKRWLYFNYAHQIIQATISGQGIALCRLPLIEHHLEKGDLIELLPSKRLDTPVMYWLILGPNSQQRPEVQVFNNWLIQEAHASMQNVANAQTELRSESEIAR